MSSHRPEFFSSGVRHKWHFPVLWVSSLPNHPLMSPSQHSVFFLRSTQATPQIILFIGFHGYPPPIISHTHRNISSREHWLCLSFLPAFRSVPSNTRHFSWSLYEPASLGWGGAPRPLSGNLNFFSSGCCTFRTRPTRP